MCINNFIYDLRRLKYKCVQAYFHFQLEEAEVMTNEGKGYSCVREENFVRNTLLEIKNRIEKNNNSYEDIVKYARTNPIIAPYYNTIENIVKKHFAAGIGWIPSFLAVEVLRQFQDKGYKDFDDIDLIKVLEEYEKFEDRKSSNLGVHYRCAEEIVRSISEKKVFTKKKINKKGRK